MSHGPRNIFELLDEAIAKKGMTLSDDIEKDIANGRVNRHVQIRVYYRWWKDDPDPAPRTFNRYEVDRFAAAMFDLSLKATITGCEKVRTAADSEDIISYDIYADNTDSCDHQTNITPQLIDALTHVLTCHPRMSGEESSYDSIPKALDRRPSTML